jgi:ABC-type oligopeptide transport system substrate-binding subunit
MNKTLKRLLSLLIILAIFASFMACGTKTTDNSGDADSPETSDSGNAPEEGNNNASAGNEGGTSAKDTLNVAVSLDNGTLDPIYITGSGGWLAAATTYMEPLFDFTQEGERILVSCYSI